MLIIEVLLIAIAMPERHINDMDLKHLRYFVAAVEEGSLLRAAHRLNVAQPALTRRMQDLEAEMGCTLLIRGSRGVSATPAGLSLYRDAVAMIDESNAVIQKTRRLGLEQEREIRLGLAPSASRKYGFIQKALARFAEAHQSAGIAFSPDASSELVAHIRKGECDIALLFEQIPANPHTESRLIHSERYILAAYHSHELAEAAPVSLAEISGQPLVWLSRRDQAEESNPLMQRLRQHGVEPTIRHLTLDTGGQLDLVSAGAGICLTPASTMAIVPEGQLCFRPIRDFDMLLEFRLAWQKAPSSDLVTSLLADFDAGIEQHQAEVASATLDWTRLCGESLVELP